MTINLSLFGNQNYRIYDTPLLSGRVYSDYQQLELIALMLYVDSSMGNFVENIVVDNYDNQTGEFSTSFPVQFDRLQEGKISLIGLFDSSHRATLDNDINSDNDVTVNITTTDNIKKNGYCRIDNELIRYELDNNLLRLRQRGIYGTFKVSHTASSEIKFAYSQQTATPRYPYKIEEKTL